MWPETLWLVFSSLPRRLYSELIPALRYTLEWIYQFVIFQDENHFLFRQCASALIALLSKANTVNYSSFDKLSFCFSKWFTMAAQYGNLEVMIKLNYSQFRKSLNEILVLIFFPPISALASGVISNVFECYSADRRLSRFFAELSNEIRTFVHVSFNV